MRALEPAASIRAGARAVCASAAAEARGPGGRCHRLRAQRARPDSPVGPGPLPHTRHRRLRPLGFPGGAPPAFRGGPQLHRRGGAQGARGRWPGGSADGRPRHHGARRRSGEARALEGLKHRAMNAAASVVEVRVPDMGNFKDVAVIDVLVKPGDNIAIDTPLVTLESDKATMDVPSTAVGVIEMVHTSKGGKVNTGDLIATVRANGAPSAPGPAQTAPAPAVPAAAPRAAAPPAASAAPAASPAPAAAPGPTATAPAAAAPPAHAPDAPSVAARGAVLTPRSLLGVPTSYRSDLAPIDDPAFTRAHASPSVRRFARELGVNLARVTGHGFKERITHEDVKAFVKGTLATPAAGSNAAGVPAAPAGAAAATARG